MYFQKEETIPILNRFTFKAICKSNLRCERISQLKGARQLLRGRLVWMSLLQPLCCYSDSPACAGEI